VLPSHSTQGHALSRLFISHSGADNVSAIAFKQWLGANGWPGEDVFLDLDDIGGGERWKEALRKAHSRCEAVVLLASPDALASTECLAEVRKAEDFGKEIIVVLLRDLTIKDRRLDTYKERQIVDLSAPPLAHVESVNYRDTQQTVRFNGKSLAKIKDYLVRRGITPESFPWPPAGKHDAEPFPGLSAFTEDEAAIFFGRDSDILTGLDEFRLLRRKGNPRFMAIQAASGAGKSSYLRAGLWPRLCRDPDFAPLAILRPAQGILTGPDGLGHKLAKQLSRPGAPVNPGDIYTQLMAKDATKAATEFIKLIQTAAAQAHDQRRIGDRDAPAPALVFAVDQAEELLAPEDAAESERFLILLAGLMREPPQGVEPFGLLTVRTDNATRLFQVITKENLEAPQTLTLLPLPRTSYRDVILKPIDVIKRRGQRITISPALADRLVADAKGADALPLLAFTLFQLYEGFGAAGSITIEQYEAIGGVAGSIEKALNNALAKPSEVPAIPGTKDEQFACLRATFIPWLARIDPDTGEAKRRVARLDDFVGASQAMVKRLEKARLLVTDRHSDVDVVEVAHESLLRQWPALTGWLQAVGDDLRIIDSVERAADDWSRNGELSAWLDHRADRLSAAERVAAHQDFRRRLGERRIEYLNACRAREDAEQREKEEALAREAGRLAEIAAAQARTARLQRRSRWILVAFTAAVVVAVGAVTWQLRTRERALEQQKLNTQMETMLRERLEASAPPASIGDTVVDFLHVTIAAPVPAQPILKKYGIEIVKVEPASSKIVLVPHSALYGYAAVVPTMSPNFLTQVDTGNVPASFTLVFSDPLVTFSFVRPDLYRATESGISFPAWVATALDAQGRQLSSVSEALLRSIPAIPGDISAQTYRLRTPNFDRIAAVRFDSDPRLNGVPFAGFSAILIEGMALKRL
jgi:hypothetical protein